MQSYSTLSFHYFRFCTYLFLSKFWYNLRKLLPQARSSHRRHYIKNILQFSQESTFARAFFLIKLQAPAVVASDCSAGVFLWILQNLKEQLFFFRTPPSNCLWQALKIGHATYPFVKRYPGIFYICLVIEGNLVLQPLVNPVLKNGNWCLFIWFFLFCFVFLQMSNLSSYGS